MNTERKIEILLLVLNALKDEQQSYDLTLGLCRHIRRQLCLSCENIEDIELFNKQIAIEKFSGCNGVYWWYLFDFENRIKYLEWMIKQYCNKK